MELRSELVMKADAEIVQKLGELFAWDHYHVEREDCAAAIVDAILAHPTIKQGLALYAAEEAIRESWVAALPDAPPKDA